MEILIISTGFYHTFVVIWISEIKNFQDQELSIGFMSSLPMITGGKKTAHLDESEICVGSSICNNMDTLVTICPASWSSKKKLRRGKRQKLVIYRLNSVWTTQWGLTPPVSGREQPALA